jgi:hypothetical protein
MSGGPGVVPETSVIFKQLVSESDDGDRDGLWIVGNF